MAATTVAVEESMATVATLVMEELVMAVVALAVAVVVAVAVAGGCDCYLL